MKNLLIFVALLICSHASAQQYPTKPVRMIIPFAPGGASDLVGRIIQPRFGELLGQQIVVDNRPGASGNLGLEAAAKAAPDGYTVFLGNVGTIAINVGVFPKLPVTPTKDFIAITQVVDVPGVLVAHPSFQPNSIRDLVAQAKAHPGKINYASPGSGSQNRLEMEVVRNAHGLDMVHIPYKGGAGPAATGLIAGETHLMFTTLSSVLGHVQGGRLKALAVVAPKRLAVLPNVPTMAESGFPNSTAGSWQGIFVPTGTPKPVVDRLYTIVTQTMKHPDVLDRLGKNGVDVVTSASPAAFATFVASETQRWGKLAKESGATVD